MNIVDFKNKLHLAIEDAKSKGWTIKPNVWISNNRKCCCPMGAYFMQVLGEWADPLYPENNMKVLNLEENACYAFADGFDGTWFNKYSGIYYTYWKLGKQFRDKYNNPTNE